MNSIEAIPERTFGIKDVVKGQKCPFRKKIETHMSGSITEEYMMPCDPDCFALCWHKDKQNRRIHFGCLMMSHYTDRTPMYVSYPEDYKGD